MKGGEVMDTSRGMNKRSASFEVVHYVSEDRI